MKKSISPLFEACSLRTNKNNAPAMPKPPNRGQDSTRSEPCDHRKKRRKSTNSMKTIAPHYVRSGKFKAQSFGIHWTWLAWAVCAIL